MAATVISHGTITTSTSEQTIGAQQTTAGSYILTLNADAMVAGDRIDIYCYMKADTADSESLFDQWTLSGDLLAQTGAPIISQVVVFSSYSMTFKIKRIAGSDRAITYSLSSP